MGLCLFGILVLSKALNDLLPQPRRLYDLHMRQVLQRSEFDAARRCGKTGGKGIFVVFTDLYIRAEAVDHIV